ncbi:MAG: two-component system response regulator [Polyangiaceae bacterium]|jgi:putative two-component system response regulator|nr:two-component system response regulator [Polyangiaceae bacterium]
MATILIVDDAYENLTLLTELLMPTYEVRAVTSGERALKAAQGEPRPDLILLDVMMPGMDGHEVLKRLKADERTRNIPVLFVTAMDSSADEEQGLLLGAVDYITKPIKPAIALARVRAQLDLKVARDWLTDRNSALEEEVRRRLKEIQFTQDVTIRALGHLAEIRDPETGNHLRRTQGYVRTLCEGLRDNPRFSSFLTPENIELLEKSAPLHDIGKVGIPDHILLKPGKLTAEEWDIMKTHSMLGWHALALVEADAERSIPFLAFAKEIARHHHEKWDGSGYPDGLAGDAIPIAARLMALADVFDALTSRRPYKEPFSIERSTQIIVEGRGKHFDPDLVDTYLRLRDTFVEISERYADSTAEVNEKVQAFKVIVEGAGS